MIGSINGVNLNAYSTPVESVQTAGVSAANTQEVEFSYNPQDQTVMDPVTVNLTTEKGAKAPQTENVRLSRSETLKPNAEGNYVYEAGTREYITANSMAAVQHTVDRMGDIFGQEINFAFGDKQIDLHADAGVDLNAYYSRDEASINFFHDFDPVTHKTVYSGASGEVISHEAGHAILDAVRPDFLETWKADTNGLHEAFGDLTALYMSSQNDEVCKLVAQQTGGDLSKPNILANTGEELGTAINNKYGQNATGGDYVRTMINDCKWENPSGVPRRPNKEHPVSTEMHDWSRIFTGAQYDVMTAITQRNIAAGMDPAQAIKAAGKESMELLAGGIKRGPQRDASYRDVALNMLRADAEENGGKAHDIILNSFKARNILQEGDDTPTPKLTATVRQEPRDLTITLDGPEFGKFSGAKVSSKVEDNGEVGMVDTSALELAQDMKQLIQNGCILYTEPNQTVEKKDLFDKNVNPYIGVVRWTNGEMTIERNKMIG